MKSRIWESRSYGSVRGRAVICPAYSNTGMNLLHIMLKLLFFTLILSCLSLAQKTSIKVSFKDVGAGVHLSLDSVKEITPPFQFRVDSGVRVLAFSAETLKTAWGKKTGSAVFSFSINDPRNYTIFYEIMYGEDGENIIRFVLDTFVCTTSVTYWDEPNRWWEHERGCTRFLAKGQHKLVINCCHGHAVIRNLYLFPLPDDVKEHAFFNGAENLMIYPAYGTVKQGRPDFSLFYLTSLAAKNPNLTATLPLTIIGPKQESLFTGELPITKQALITLQNPQAGKYIIKVGQIEKSWEWFYPRLEKLKTNLHKLETTKNSGQQLDFWLPSLRMYYDNVITGYQPLSWEKGYLNTPQYAQNRLTLAESLSAQLLHKINPVPEPGQGRYSFSKTFSKTLQIKYLLFLPESYKTGTHAWPLLIYLHGAGQRGDNLENIKGETLPRYAEAHKDFPFILLSPQCPENLWWDQYSEIEKLDALLDGIIANYNIDTSRVYLTGSSMGGFGTWAWAMERPERFAALAPICGAGNTAKARRIRDIPVWIFHGAKDNVVPVKASEEMARALKELGNNAKLTIYPDIGHVSWTLAYEDPELYRWFLSNNKSTVEGKKIK